MRIEKSFAHRLKVQINTDTTETPIQSGTYYIKFKRNDTGKYWNGTSWVDTDGDYLALTHDQAGLWQHQLTSDATDEEGQYTAFFSNDSNPRIYDSLDITVIETLNWYSATGH